MKLVLIAALARNRVIGKGSQIPWRLPADLQRFKRLTMGHPMLMGRKTFESIGKPLPGRETVVITRQPGFAPAGVRVASSLEAALAPYEHTAQEVFCAGGSEIYALCLPRADKLVLTHIEHDFEGDVLFPEVDLKPWKLVAEERFAATDAFPYAYRFSDYER